MQTVNVDELRADPNRVIAAAQTGDVLILSEGKVVAVVSRPQRNEHFPQYWAERETSLKDVVAAADWDSTSAIETDRDRA